MLVQRYFMIRFLGVVKLTLGASKSTLSGSKYNKREVEFSQMRKEENKNLTKHYNCQSKK